MPTLSNVTLFLLPHLQTIMQTTHFPRARPGPLEGAASRRGEAFSWTSNAGLSGAGAMGIRDGLQRANAGDTGCRGGVMRQPAGLLAALGGVGRGREGRPCPGEGTQATHCKPAVARPCRRRGAAGGGLRRLSGNVSLGVGGVGHDLRHQPATQGPHNASSVGGAVKEGGPALPPLACRAHVFQRMP